MRALIVTYLFMALSLFAFAMMGNWLRVEALIDPVPQPQARFELYKGGDGEHWWRLKGPDNQVIASGEGYPDKGSAESDIQKVKEYARDAEIEEIDAK